jgi:predicted TIM-barrel fold metal-dependent hydrolase
MKYQRICGDYRIDTLNLSVSFKNRKSSGLSELLKSKHVFDTHFHVFDIKCINKSYFLLRFLKDIVGLKTGGSENTFFSEELAYKDISTYSEGWEKNLRSSLENQMELIIEEPDVTAKGVIDVVKALKFLSFDKMIDVYEYYIKNYSLASVLGLYPTDVIVTALTMDLETGWDVKIPKPLSKQIQELKDLSKVSPVLPFLYCDPRRANLKEPEDNLYSLFNRAFCEDPSFFGVKIYPALGYDPSDYRLWPIYEVCELNSIPIITHCGGETISTDKLSLNIFEGQKKIVLSEENRKGIAYNLNNPVRWKPVLERFPNLKISFAHFGGYKTWASGAMVDSKIDPQHRKETIMRFMRKYPNVYADFAFDFIEDKASDNLINVIIIKNSVRDRVLFGTDYWLVNPSGNLEMEQNIFIDKLKKFSKEDLDLVGIITVKNPMEFLFSNEI